MKNADDTVDISGNYSIYQGFNYTNELSDGVMSIGGNLVQMNSDYYFAPISSGNNKVVLNGEDGKIQKVIFLNKYSKFNNLEITQSQSNYEFPYEPCWDKLTKRHIHNYTSKVTKKPTCTETGVRTYTCECGDTYTEDIDKLIDISTCNISLPTNTQYFRGTRVRPVVTISSEGSVLKSGTDYTVAYFNNLSVGTATVKITGKGRYGGTINKEFSIVQRSIANCDVSLAFTVGGYKADYREPAVTVKCNGAELYSGNYKVTYYNNLNVGTSTVEITGKNNLKGSVTKTFKITPRAISECNITLSKNDSDYEHPTVSLTYYGREISSDNYTVNYSEINDNKITVTISGKNNLKGEVIKTYEIDPIMISECEIGLNQAKYYFTGARIKPVVNVSYNGTMISNKNYTIIYNNNLTVGMATITIKGKNLLTGTITKSFVINPRSIASCTITIKKNLNNKNKPDVFVSYYGREIYSGNYSVSYDYVSNTQIKITITGKNNLTGVVTKTYDLV